ncbi:MAG: hypothetical protein GDA44_05295 [Prochloron sp. SP5CPC1]|nr:hypothetical protein [Candidatus Paraprochloron terpiosi SP5CPC1]
MTVDELGAEVNHQIEKLNENVNHKSDKLSEEVNDLRVSVFFPNLPGNV